MRNWTDAEHGSHESIHYFHCDQIGRPQELTDAEGRLLWYGEYDALGRLEREEDICGVSQPFRLQNQHYDEETGLHYNLLRYYDADMGRFLTQDPIGLLGGENAYTYAPNVQMWIDPLGLNPALALGGYELWMLLFGGAVVVAGQQAAQSGGFTGSRSSAGEAAVSISDVGRCNRPEPKCPPNVFEKLTENVNKAKELTGALGSCSQHMSKYDLKMREKAWLKHALARSIREQTCWDGGDKGHQMAIAAAWKNYYKCKDFLL